MSHRSASLLILLLVWHQAATAQDTYPRQSGIDVEHYAFHIGLTDSSDAIAMQEVATVRMLEAGVSQVRLDLVSTGAGDVEGTGMTVAEVRVDDVTAGFRHENNILTIDLATAPMAEQRVRIAVKYGGIPATGLRIGPNRYGRRTFFSDNWPDRARHWLATVDHISDKATHEFVVDAPSHYQVVSNGLRIEESDLGNGYRRTHWKQSVPTSPWLYCLGVAEFAVLRTGEFDGKELQVWVNPEDRDAGFVDLDGPTRHSLEFFSDYVGPFAYEKLANVQASSVSGGMEAASAIFYAETSSTGQAAAFWRRNAIIHEIAHQWFGNAVTEADWDHVWLSEGITTYFTLLFREHAYGRQDFVDGLRDSRRVIWAFHQTHPDYRIVHDHLSDMSQVTSRQTYQKGAWFMHMLRDRIGDSAFQEGIRDYYATHFNGNATTDDLVRAMETASDDDLGEFFRQWLYRGAHPVLDGGWHYADGVLTVDLAQVQGDGRYFDLPVEIGVYASGVETPSVHRTRLIGPDRRSVSIELATRPERVVLDPRTVLLAEWSFMER